VLQRFWCPRSCVSDFRLTRYAPSSVHTWPTQFMGVHVRGIHVRGTPSIHRLTSNHPTAIGVGIDGAGRTVTVTRVVGGTDQSSGGIVFIEPKSTHFGRSADGSIFIFSRCLVALGAAVGRNNRRALRRFRCEERPTIRDPCAASARHAVSLVARFIRRNARWLLRPTELAERQVGYAVQMRQYAWYSRWAKSCAWRACSGVSGGWP